MAAFLFEDRAEEQILSRWEIDAEPRLSSRREFDDTADGLAGAPASRAVSEPRTLLIFRWRLPAVSRRVPSAPRCRRCAGATWAGHQGLAPRAETGGRAS